MGIVSMNCPNCGAQVEMDDSREFGYCNMCGSKVMVDKMIVEHKGSVKIDQSDKVKNALTVARRARDTGDNATAQRYYDIVLTEEPNNWEAYFYSTVCGTGEIKNAEIGAAIEKVATCYNSTMLVIDEELTNPEENFQAKNDVSRAAGMRIIELYTAAYNFSNAVHGINSVSLSATGFCRSAIENALKLIERVDALSAVDQRYRKTATELYKALMSVAFIRAVGTKRYNHWLIKKEQATEIANRIREDEPEYQSLVEASPGGCYVATCVYGSYDCPQVWTLRRYRDDTLASTWYGRAFIRTYYAVSPTLVKRFGKTKWFKKIWQGKLDRMVRRLNASGVADTPYNDKRW